MGNAWNSRAKSRADKINGLVLVALTRFIITKIMVRLAGIEPTTLWFVAKYSFSAIKSMRRHLHSRKCVATHYLFFDIRQSQPCLQATFRSIAQ